MNAARTSKEDALHCERPNGNRCLPECGIGLFHSPRCPVVHPGRDPAARLLVIVESPYAGDVRRNVRYLRACLRDSLLRGEAPFASHAIYTQPGVLRDRDAGERAAGIEAGLVWAAHAELTAVYADLGISRGMEQGIEHAARLHRPVEYRELRGAWEAGTHRGG